MEINEYLSRLGFPDEAITFVCELCKKLSKMPEFTGFLEDIRNYRSFSELITDVDAFAEKIGISQYSVYVTLLSAALPIMEQRYREKGLPDEMFWEMAKDLKFKLMECHNVDGIWGVRPFTWYDYNYSVKRYALGRLQFEPSAARYNYCHGKLFFKKDGPSINVHIHSGCPLNYNEIMDSFQQAAKMLGPNCGDKTVFTVRSWLLYPPYRNLYKEGSNLQKFFDLFHIVLVGEYEPGVFHECWHVFNTRDFSDPSALPTDTSLQRAFVDYIKEGNRFGYGDGLFIYPPDTEKK